MSSRNVRLTPAMRAAAPSIRKALLEAVDLAATKTPAEVIAATVERIDAVDGLETEYFQIVDGHTCQPISEWAETDMPVGCVTVYAGDVRLIDNIKF